MDDSVYFKFIWVGGKPKSRGDNYAKEFFRKRREQLEKEKRGEKIEVSEIKRKRKKRIPVRKFGFSN